MSLDIHAREVATPFRMAFRHAAAERNNAQSVWVEVGDGQFTGRGEGCPREYVTGENVESALEFVAVAGREVRDAGNAGQLRDWVSCNRERIDRAPAAWCALELAMLDYLAQREGVPVESLLGLPALANRFRYTAVLGDSKDPVFAAQLEQYQALGFSDFKLKVNGEPERDAARIHAVNTIPGAVLRIDANNLWRDVDALRHWSAKARPKILAIEEPLATSSLDELRAAADLLEVPVILDENFLRLEQLAELAPDPHRWIVNLRVSKLGGLFRSLDVVRLGREMNLRMIAGAQVGETSILTRAALPVAQAMGDLLAGQEGAFGEYLLERDLVQPVLQFGRAGNLDASAVVGQPGWGLGPRKS